MNNDLTHNAHNAHNTPIASFEGDTQKLISDALSEATKRAYLTDWDIFNTFCKANHCTPLPTTQDTLIAFLTAQAMQNKAIQTIRRRLAAIKFMHNIKGFDIDVTDKIITLVLRGIARQSANRPSGQKKPLSLELLHQMLDNCDTSVLMGKRDKALLLFGFSGAFRRSEICNIMLDDLEETKDGLKVHIRSSKGDQFGKGQIVALPHGQKMEMVATLKDYLNFANIHDGYVFRAVSKGGNINSKQLTPLSVALIVKKYITATGNNPDHYAAHSIRSGFLTEAATSGANLFKMLEVSRHKSADTVLGYVRNSELFKNHAGKDFL